MFLHVYDLSQGLAQQLSEAILGQRLEGIWYASSNAMMSFFGT